jgi:hypothetical protein
VHPSYYAGPRPLVTAWAAGSALAWSVEGCAFANYTSFFAAGAPWCGVAAACGVSVGCNLWVGEGAADAAAGGVPLGPSELQAPPYVVARARARGAVMPPGVATGLSQLRCPVWTESATGSYSPSQPRHAQVLLATVLSQYTRNAAATMMVATAAVSPSLGAALQRAATLAALIECDARIGDVVDVLSSPTRLAVGASGARYYRGAIVGNVVVVWCGASSVALVIAVVAARRAGRGRRALRAALGALHLPGWMLHVYLPLLQPTVIGAVVVLRYAAGAGDVVLGMVGLACAALPVAWICVVLGPRFGAVPLRAPPVEDDRVVRAAWAQRLWSFLTRPSAEYGDAVRGTHFAAMYGALMEAYRCGRHWFVCVELLSELSLGVVGGMVPVADGEPPRSCAALQVAMAAVVGATGLAMLLLRPYGVVLEGVTGSVNVVFALTACVLVVALGRGPIADTASAATMWETTAVSTIPLLLSLLARRPAVLAARLVGVLGCGSLCSPTAVPLSRSHRLELPHAGVDPHANLQLLVQCVCFRANVRNGPL